MTLSIKLIQAFSCHRRGAVTHATCTSRFIGFESSYLSFFSKKKTKKVQTKIEKACKVFFSVKHFIVFLHFLVLLFCSTLAPCGYCYLFARLNI